MAKRGRKPFCDINHAALDTLTPESLYWYGFLFADGSVSDCKYGAPALTLELCEKDRGHVEKFRSFIGSTHKIRDRVRKGGFVGQRYAKERSSVSLRFNSEGMIRKLREHGMVSKAARVPSKELAHSRDFWRGCVDGDGTIRLTRLFLEKYQYPAVIFCGQLALLESFRRFLEHNGITDMNINEQEKSISRIQTTGVKAVTIIRLLYENATVALDRKLETAKMILARDHKGTA